MNIMHQSMHLRAQQTSPKFWSLKEKKINKERKRKQREHDAQWA